MDNNPTAMHNARASVRHPLDIPGLALLLAWMAPWLLPALCDRLFL